MTPEARAVDAARADRRPEVERHWLVFNHGREVTGCHCGFKADPDDYGWGDSVVDHLLALAAAPPQPDQAVTATVEAEFERGVRQAMFNVYDHAAPALGTAGEAGS